MNGKILDMMRFTKSWTQIAKLKFSTIIKIIFITSLALKKVKCVCNKENILILVVDDLRPLLAEWGDEIAHTPHISNLAAKSVIFKNTFAQQALCAPSRNSLLTGRRPDTLKLYDFYSYWRTQAGNFTTLPQYFKENGYKSLSFGKVFHPGKSSNWTDDYPFSWSEIPYHPSTEIYKDSKVCVDEKTGKLEDNLVCPVIVKQQPEKTLPDIQISIAAIEKLKQHNKSYKSKPYFMAVGFHKPHIPLKFPQEYLDLYPINNISLPKELFRPPGMPSVAWNPWTDVRHRHDIKQLNISFPFGVMPEEWTLKIKQNYYAAVSYIDVLIGNVLQNVDFNNTIVVLTSDHGWSLGEHGEWAKYSNFDVALKVPLLIYVPGLTDVSPLKKVTNKIVELVDLFPTLVDLAGFGNTIPQCPENENSDLCFEGFSLVPLIKSVMQKKNIDWRHPAFSQYPRPGLHPTIKPNSDEPRLNDITIMGYSMRTRKYRYTEWVSFNHTTCRADWNNVRAKEMYFHNFDKEENLNLSDRLELKNILYRLSKKLRKGWRFINKVKIY